MLLLCFFVDLQSNNIYDNWGWVSSIDVEELWLNLCRIVLIKHFIFGRGLIHMRKDIQEASKSSNVYWIWMIIWMRWEQWWFQAAGTGKWGTDEEQLTECGYGSMPERMGGALYRRCLWWLGNSAEVERSENNWERWVIYERKARVLGCRQTGDNGDSSQEILVPSGSWWSCDKEWGCRRTVTQRESQMTIGGKESWMNCEELVCERHRRISGMEPQRRRQVNWVRKQVTRQEIIF